MSAARSRAAGREDGFAVPAAIGIAGVLVALALAGTAGGQVLVAQRRAATAADLTALAGAVAVQQGRDPCGAARRLAALDLARVTSCRVAGDEVGVTTAVGLTLAGRAYTVRARAKAGPRAASAG